MSSTTQAPGSLNTSFFLPVCAVLIVGVAAFVALFPVLALALLGAMLVGHRIGHADPLGIGATRPR